MENEITAKIAEWLVFGGGIMVAAQFVKRYAPVTFGERVPAGAFWAGVFALVAAVFTHDGAFDAAAIFPVLSQGVVYWLTAHGIYDGVNAKGNQAFSLLAEIWGEIDEATDEAWQDLPNNWDDIEDEGPAA